MDVFTPVLQHYRWYGDGTESGSTAVQTEDNGYTTPSLSGDTIYHLRVGVQNTTAVAGASNTFALQYNRNSAGWVTVTAATTYIRAATGSGLTDGSATTDRASGLTNIGSFQAGLQEESSGSLTFTQNASSWTEHVFAIQIVNADVSNGDVITFRLTLDGGSPGMANNVTPSLTITKSNPISISQTSPVAATAAVLVPTVTAGVSVNIQAQPATATAAIPAALGKVSRVLYAVVMTASAAIPTHEFSAVEGGSKSIVQTSPIAATAQIPTPTLKIDVSIQAVPATATGSIPAPSTRQDVNISAVPATATGSIPVPTLAVEIDVSIGAVPAAATGAIPVPEVEQEVQVSGVPATAGAAIPVPTLKRDVAVSGVPAAATGSVPAPSLKLDVSIQALPATAAGAIPAATAVVGTSIFAEPATAAAAIPTPGIAVEIDVSVGAVPATAGAAVPVASFSIGTSIQAVPATAGAAVPGPSIALSVSLQAQPAAAAAAVPVHAFSTGVGVSVQAVPARARAAVPATTWDTVYACWKVDEASGTRYEEVADRDLTETGTVGATTGKDGSAATFTDATTYLESPSTLTLCQATPNAGASWSVWVRRSAIPTPSNNMVFGGGTTGSAAWGIRVNNSGKAWVFVTNQVTYLPITAAGPNVCDGGWHLLVMTWNENHDYTVRGYVDGELIGSNSSGAYEKLYTTALNHKVRLGIHPTGATEPWGSGGADAWIDETVIWERALTAAEVADLWAAEAGRFYPGNQHTLSIGVEVEAVPAAATAQVPVHAFSVQNNISIQAEPAGAGAAIPTPGVSAGLNVSIDAVPAQATAEVLVPSLSLGTNILAVPAQATGSIPVHSLEAALVLRPTPAAAAAAIPTPSVESRISIQAVPAAASAAVPGPGVGADVEMWAQPVRATARVLIPELGGTTPVSIQAVPATALAFIPSGTEALPHYDEVVFLFAG